MEHAIVAAFQTDGDSDHRPAARILHREGEDVECSSARKCERDEYARIDGIFDGRCIIWPGVDRLQYAYWPEIFYGDGGLVPALR